MSTLTTKQNTFVYHTLLSDGEHADIYIDKMVPQLSALCHWPKQKHAGNLV